MNKAYLIYRPVMDYEESMEPHFACTTKAEAESCLNKMRDFMEELLTRLPEFPEDGDAEPERWDQVDVERRQILTTTEWPYGVSLVYEIEYGANKWDRNCLAIMELEIQKP